MLSFSGDVVIASDLRAEIKARANGSGFAMVERWLGGNEVLFLRRDRAEPADRDAGRRAVHSIKSGRSLVVGGNRNVVHRDADGGAIHSIRNRY